MIIYYSIDCNIGASWSRLWAAGGGECGCMRATHVPAVHRGVLDRSSAACGRVPNNDSGVRLGYGRNNNNFNVNKIE